VVVAVTSSWKNLGSPFWVLSNPSELSLLSFHFWFTCHASNTQVKHWPRPWVNIRLLTCLGNTQPFVLFVSLPPLAEILCVSLI
jgi:hypothetical protein